MRTRDLLRTTIAVRNSTKRKLHTHRPNSPLGTNHHILYGRNESSHFSADNSKSLYGLQQKPHYICACNLYTHNNTHNNAAIVIITPRLSLYTRIYDQHTTNVYVSLRHSKHAVPHHHISEMNHRADVWAAYYSAWRPANNCFGVSIYITNCPSRLRGLIWCAARRFVRNMLYAICICAQHIVHLYMRPNTYHFVASWPYHQPISAMMMPCGGAHCVRALLASRRLRQFVQCTKFIVLVIANVFSACAIIYSRAIALRFDRKRALSLYLAH